jgi:hypothetical protein
VLRRFPRSWPAIGAVVGMAFLVFSVVIAPVFLEPLFNRFTRSPTRGSGIPSFAWRTPTALR